MKLLKKTKKFLRSPPVFLKDFFNKRYPTILNEMRCPEEEEEILIRHDFQLEEKIESSFPIDIVFTWVNDKDPVWIDKYNKHFKSNRIKLGNNATDSARFSDHNELYFSVKSVLTQLSWVRNIFIVTDDQIPSWYNPKTHKKITIIDHKKIIDERYLPTFNSHVIEAHIHKIDGLAEHFIYFNDDVFAARKLSRGHFFESNGLCSTFVSSKSLFKMKQTGFLTPTLSASLKSSNLIEKKHGLKIDSPLIHTYVPLRKSEYEAVWETFGHEINEFLPNKFRTDEDLNLATFLVPWFCYARGKSCLRRDICYYFNIRSNSSKTFYSFLLKKKHSHDAPHSFCANDFSAKISQDQDYHYNLESTLRNYFKEESEK